MPSKPTTTRDKILREIARSWREFGLAPSYRELKRDASVRRMGTVVYHLKRLEADGLIERYERIPRSIRLTPAGRALAEGVGDLATA